jgi:4,5-dihydroxyphthalate decarboxylase
VTLTDLPTPTFGGGYDGQARPRMGFFTDTSICIGCKACEVACKEWNLVPQDGPLRISGDSYDNTGALGANTWRHVAFIEQTKPVQVPDVDLGIEQVQPEQRHHKMLHDLAYDVCEYSSINYLSDWHAGLPFTAIPVFPYRTFRHRDIWVSEAAGVQEPSQLNDQRIGIQNWDNSAAVWQRGPLQQDHGLDLASVEWVCSILPETANYQPPAWLRMTQAPAGRSLEELLVAGEIAAMMVPWPAKFPAESAGQVRRLFPNFPAVEQEYYARHHAFPIMHTVVIKNALLAEHPWVAERVYTGVQQALDTYVAEQRAANAPSAVWRELSWAEQEQRLGRQPWPGGVSANRPTLETAVSYALEQGIIQRRVAPEELFQLQGRPLVAAG